MHPNIFSDPSLIFDTVPPRRIVSLIPSTTASLFDLGLGGSVVGITDFCSYPAEPLAVLPRIGGPQNPRINDILALRPDLIIANREENDRPSIEALAEAGIPIWLTFPTTVQAAMNDLWAVAHLFRSDLAMRQVDMLERSVEWALQAAADQPPLRYFCPIWQDVTANGTGWWMTFNAESYPNDVLRLFNGQNIFAERSRRYPFLADLGQAAPEAPDDRDTRYPRVTLPEILAAQPEIILLPSEPYAYSEQDCAAWMTRFAETPAAQSGRIFALDGTLITWHGTRLARALEELPAFFTT